MASGGTKNRLWGRERKLTLGGGERKIFSVIAEEEKLSVGCERASRKERGGNGSLAEIQKGEVHEKKRWFKCRKR